MLEYRALFCGIDILRLPFRVDPTRVCEHKNSLIGSSLGRMAGIASKKAKFAFNMCRSARADKLDVTASGFKKVAKKFHTTIWRSSPTSMGS